MHINLMTAKITVGKSNNEVRMSELTYSHKRENTVDLYHSFKHFLLVCTINVKTTATSAF